jgi:tRNA (cmo5U34)-methyltransferase
MENPMSVGKVTNNRKIGTKTNIDRVFGKKRKSADFSFDEEVASVFDDMLQRSVPFYSEMHRLTLELTERFAKNNTNIYDLGTSTGSTLLMLAKNIRKEKVKFIGIDNSTPMLEHAKEKLKSCGCWTRCELINADLNKPIVFERPSVVISILTLQFVRPLQREHLIKQICESLVENGCMILFEKVLGNDSLTNRVFIDLYYEYKKRSGYSQLEIMQKREALENVLIPYRVDENIMLLRRNGFPVVDVFFKWHNFAGFIAIKR